MISLFALFLFFTTSTQESVSQILTGLPAQHFSFVKNIDPGLPLFLFNYTDRKLHGIFEAASSGQMNINPYAWTTDGSERTLFPAQVLFEVLVARLIYFFKSMAIRLRYDGL